MADQQATQAEIAIRRLADREALTHVADGFCDREVESGDTVNAISLTDVDCPDCIAALSPSESQEAQR